jgi:pantetheine-phosphate adenylyltransferase
MGITRKGIYPGSFDPLTNGHLDIIIRAAALCDMLIVAVARNSAKEPLFSLEERLEILQECYPGNSSIEVVSFDGLLADFCVQNGVSFIFRGLRSSADFEYERSIALTNRCLAPGVETVFLTASAGSSYISSSIVREVALHRGDVSSFVPSSVVSRLQSKFS